MVGLCTSNVQDTDTYKKNRMGTGQDEVVPVLNKVSCHDYIWVSGGIATCININTRWR